MATKGSVLATHRMDATARRDETSKFRLIKQDGIKLVLGIIKYRFDVNSSIGNNVSPKGTSARVAVSGSYPFYPPAISS